MTGRAAHRPDPAAPPPRTTLSPTAPMGVHARVKPGSTPADTLPSDFAPALRAQVRWWDYDLCKSPWWCGEYDWPFLIGTSPPRAHRLSQRVKRALAC